MRNFIAFVEIDRTVLAVTGLKNIYDLGELV